MTVFILPPLSSPKRSASAPMEGRERHKEEEAVVVEEARGGGGFNSPTTIFSVPFIRHIGQLGTTAN